MKRPTLLAVAALTLAPFVSALAGGGGWITDMKAAKAQAAKEKKDLLLDFTGSDWCGWCIKLDEEVFSTDVFKAGIKDKFVPVELDFPKKKELDAKLQEQNTALQEKMKIEGFPTVILCDATGKPYAVTGYQEGGPEKYVKALDELQAARVKRDQEFAQANDAKDNLEKAKHLVAGLKAMEERVIETHYADVVEKISQLDKDDTTGFMKATKEAMAKREADKQQEAALQEFYASKIMPLMQEKEFDKALAGVKTYLKDNPTIPEEAQVDLLVNVRLAGPMEKNDADAAMAVVEEVAKEYPKSDLAKNIDKVKESLKARLTSPAPADTPAQEK